MEGRVPAGVYRNTSTAARVKKERIVLERDSGPRSEARKEDKDKRKVAKVTQEFAGAVGKHYTLPQIAHCTKENWNRSLNAVDEEKGDIREKVHEDELELHAWCLLEESEKEQWQEVISKESKLKLQNMAHGSVLSVENQSLRVSKKSH